MIAPALAPDVTFDVPTIVLHLERFDRAFCRLFAPPPPPRAITAYAATLRPGDGARDERKRLIVPSSHAPQWYVLQAIESARYRTILTLGPTGDGKSLATINIPIMHALFEQQENVVYAGPTRELLNKLFRQKIRKLMITSGAGHMLPKEGPGSGGGVASDITFANGATLYPMGGGGKGESAQAGVHAPKAFFEEYDDMQPDEIARVEQRTSSSGLDFCLVKTTSIKHDRESRTINEFWETTACRVQYACVECGGFQLWTWRQVLAAAVDWTSTKTAAATVAIVCSICGARLTPAQHKRSLDTHRQVSVAIDGKISTEIPDLDGFGLWWGGLDSSRKLLHYLAVKYQPALVKREKYFQHDAMRQFHRDELAEPYTDEDDGVAGSISDNLLHEISLRSTYRRGSIPHGFSKLVIAQDCQLRSHFWLAIAFHWNQADQRLRWALVDWNEISVCGAAAQPKLEERHQVLDQVDDIAERGFPFTESQHLLAAEHCAVDTAAYAREVRPWVAKHRRRWLSMRGCGQDQFGTMVEPRRGSVVQSVKGAIIVYEQTDAPDRLQGFAEASAINDELEASLHSGDGMLPVDADNRLAFHLLGIKRNPDPTGKRWIPAHRRHDWRDCLVYGIARARQFFNHPPPPPRQYGVIGNLIRR